MTGQTPGLLLDALLIAACWLAAGAHLPVPWRLAATAAVPPGPAGPAEADGPGGRPAPLVRWRLAAPALLLVAIWTLLVHLGRHPGRALEAGLGTFPATTSLTLALTVAAVALALGDLMAVLAARRLPPAAWRLLAILGLLACGVLAVTGELLRIGRAPAGPPLAVWCATGCRLLLIAGAGGMAGGWIGTPAAAAGRRPFLLATAAGLAVLGYLACLPPAVGGPMLASGYGFTAAAAALLIAAVPWLPRRLALPAQLIGLLLAAFLTETAAAVSEAIAAQLPDSMLPF